jgi:hypothetical protein
MSSVSLDESIMATLEPEERDAINGVGFSAEDIAGMTAVAAGADNDDPEDDPEDADAAPVEGQSKAEVATVAPAAAADPAAAEATVEAAAPVAPAPMAPSTAYVAVLPGDYSEQVDALKSAAAELRERFKNGDLDVDAFNEENDKLIEQREGLVAMKMKADISADMRQQSERSEWERSINRLFASAAKDGVDYTKDEARREDLDLFVKALASNAANADKTMEWFLSEGHKRVMSLYGGTPAPAPTPTPAAAVKAAAATRKPPTDAIPKTLAHVPGGDGPGDLAGEFADVDRLGGEDLEAAISKMSPTQRERYQRGL